MAQEKNPIHTPTLFDWISFLLGMLAWVLPDVHIAVKIVISATLVGALLFSRQSKSNVRRLFRLYPLLLIILPLTVSLLEYLAFWYIFDVHASLPEVIQAGFVFGLAIGLPLSLFYTWSGSILGDKGGGFYTIGCGFFIGLILVVVAAWILSKINLSFATSWGVLGPMAILLNRMSPAFEGFYGLSYFIAYGQFAPIGLLAYKLKRGSENVSPRTA